MRLAILEWTEVDIQTILQKMAARASSRIFVGYPLCRNESWIKLCLEFPINLFATAFLMRLFPPFLHPIISWIVPTRYWLRQNLKLGKKLVAPVIADYRARTASRQTDREDAEEKSNLLEWMIENAVGSEGDLEKLAPRLMFLSLASVHSTSTATTAALFDLCAHPEYIAILREEILEVMGGARDTCKEDLNKLWKMDSFLRESQRSNPVTLRTFSLRKSTL